MLTKSDYNDMAKEKKNAEYLKMLDKSIAEAEKGGFIVKSCDDILTEFESLTSKNVYET